jgi:hypothetical protein
VAERRARGRDSNNRLAFVGMYCGLASFVPLVILITFVPALVFGAIGLLKARTLPDREGQAEAFLGILMAFISLAVQGTIAGLAALIGLIG